MICCVITGVFSIFFNPGYKDCNNIVFKRNGKISNLGYIKQVNSVRPVSITAPRAGAVATSCCCGRLPASVAHGIIPFYQPAAILYQLHPWHCRLDHRKLVADGVSNTLASDQLPTAPGSVDHY